MILWRISNHLSLTGDGGLRVSARWHTRGRRIVYCSESPAAALLETLVHFEITVSDLPVRYQLLKLEAPDDVFVDTVPFGDLAKDWVERADVSRKIGDSWLATGRSALLTVPSALVPETSNVLLNPGHRDAARVVIVQVSECAIDPRLLE